MNAYMQALVKLNDFSGVVLVARDDTVCFKQAYGYADRESKIPNTTGTLFRIGSVTKQFTAAAVLLLEQEGKLSVNDKLSAYFPGFPQGDKITLHLLLCHRSGIAEYVPEAKRDKDIFSASAPEKIQEVMIRKIIKKGFDFSPGKKYEYSNSNYYLLGCIIEKVSGMSYDDYVRKNLLDPFHLSDTGCDHNASGPDNKAKGYELVKNEFRPSQFINMGAAYSAGNMYSTVEDLYAWEQQLLKSSLLSDASKKKMFTAYTFGDANEHYGYGAIIDSFIVYRKVWHSGGIYGYTSMLLSYPEENISIVILSNSDSGFDNSMISNAFSALLFGYEIVDPRKHIAGTTSGHSLTDYTGIYVSDGKASAVEEVSVILSGKKLYRRKANAKDVELKPEEEDKFFYADGSDRQLEFHRDAGGKVVSANLILHTVNFDKWKKRN
jgi:CubicO group peptidase (beta-lactamase class C family)